MAFYTPVFTNRFKLLKGQNNTMQSDAEIDALFEKAANSTPDPHADFAIKENLLAKITTKDTVNLTPHGMTHSLQRAQELCLQAEQDPFFELRTSSSKSMLK